MLCAKTKITVWFRVCGLACQRAVARGHVLVLAGALVLVAKPSYAQFPGVVTWHNDNARTGQNLFETQLNPSTVHSPQFRKLCSYPVDGIVDAQPLYVPRVKVPRKGTHNIAYVVTEFDSVYAFDADCHSSKPLWHVSFVDPTQGVTSDGEFGITGTPVINLETQTLYAVAKTIEIDPVSNISEYVLRLHALDIRNGVEEPRSPIRIQAVFPGRGVGNDNHGRVVFNSYRQIQRTGLLFLHGVVYVCWAGHRDVNPYHGWLLGYDATTLEQVAVYNDTPNGEMGGIWQSGAAPAADPEGNIFFQTGNGDFDAQLGGPDFGDSLLRVNFRHGKLGVRDYFTPYNQAYLSNNDLDLASGGVLLLPRQLGMHPYESVSAGKEGKIFVVDRKDMGKFNPTNNNQIVQTVIGSSGGYFSSPAYWQGRIYYAGVGDVLNLYTLSEGLMSTTSLSSSTTFFPYPAPTPSVSAEGSKNGIVWVIENAAGAAVLHAYDAIDLSRELYNSDQAGFRDQPGHAATFSVPTIANGKVYVGTTTDFDVYGLCQDRVRQSSVHRSCSGVIGH